MQNARTIGRVIAVLFLAQAVIAPITNFGLYSSLSAQTFLAEAAEHSTGIRLGALLSVLSGVLWIGIAVAVFPLLRQSSERAAIALLGFALVLFMGVAIEGMAARAMLAASLEFAKAGREEPGLFVAAGAVARSLRHSAHYTNLLLSAGAFLVFYGSLFRFALVPRVIPALGLAAVGALIIGALMPLLGYRVVMPLFAPMGIVQLALVAWLLVKGFQVRADAQARAA